MKVDQGHQGHSRNGLVPTMAIALAATVVNRNEMTVMVISATIALNKEDLNAGEHEYENSNKCQKQEQHDKRHLQIALRASSSLSSLLDFFLFLLPTASLKAFPITPDDLIP